MLGYPRSAERKPHTEHALAFFHPARFWASTPRLAAALALGAIVLVHGSEPPLDEAKPAWRNGPVRTLLTSDEDRAFKALKTDEERAKAIKDFWARRDPTPATPANEYKDDFAKRVGEASTEFRESTGPGWATDKGKVLLLLGYPGERKPGPEDGQETWLYGSLSTGIDAVFAGLDRQAAAGKARDAKAEELRAKLKMELVGGAKVVFSKNEAGDSTLVQGEGLLNALRALDPREGAVLSMPREKALATLKDAERAGEAVAQAPQTKPAAAPVEPVPAPKAQALAPGVERLKQAALGSDPKAEIGMTTSVRYFKSEDGSTRTVVLIAVKTADVAVGPDGKPRTVLYARLLPEAVADAPPVEFLEQELFTAQDDPAEGWIKYAFAWPLKHRKYELRVAASDGPEGKIATRVVSLDLPDFKGDSLFLSSITLAKSSAPAAGDPGGDQFRVGALRLIPWVKPALGPKDELSFFYDVYNARKDPSTSRPSLDVAYVFEKKEPSGWKKRGRLAEADKHDETLGYTISAEAISQWPAGDYRLTVQVKDKIRSADISSSVEFSVIR